MAVASVRELWLERYGNQIGRHRSEVSTPALLIDLDAAKRNIASMAAKFRELPASLRPHIKVHKCVELALLEVEAGAVGIACATAWEAEVMATGGIGDVLVANQVVQPDKVATVARVARDHRITVAVDDVRNVEQLSRAAGEAGSELELLIEIDVGMGRCGVRTQEEALPVAERIAELSHVSLRGLQGYEGHCMVETDHDVRIAEVGAANAKLIAAADHLAEHGHPCADLSGGGSGTYYITGANPRITEVQAGSYLLMDCMHGNLVPGDFEVALTVAGTVISRQGNTVVLDCGRKSVGIDYVMPPLVNVPDGEVRSYAEEHCLVDFPGTPSLDIGAVAEAMAGYGPTTVNLHDVFHIVENDVVTDIWPVNPRGAGPWRSSSARRP
jgi:D-serine deaminase-like pyridoxal phosphate-dependent protein